MSSRGVIGAHSLFSCFPVFFLFLPNFRVVMGFKKTVCKLHISCFPVFLREMSGTVNVVMRALASVDEL